MDTTIPNTEQLATYVGLMAVCQATISVILTVVKELGKAQNPQALEKYYDLIATIVALTVPVVWTIVYVVAATSGTYETYVNALILAVFVALANMGGYSIIKKLRK